MQGLRKIDNSFDISIQLDGICTSISDKPMVLALTSSTRMIQISRKDQLCFVREISQILADVNWNVNRYGIPYRCGIIIAIIGLDILTA
jgi:hypothetical protein